MYVTESSSDTARVPIYRPVHRKWFIANAIDPNQAIKSNIFSIYALFSGGWQTVQATLNIGLDKQNKQRKIVNIFLPIIFSICFG